MTEYETKEDNEANKTYFSKTPWDVMIAMAGFCKKHLWAVHRS